MALNILCKVAISNFVPVKQAVDENDVVGYLTDMLKSNGTISTKDVPRKHERIRMGGAMENGKRSRFTIEGENLTISEPRKAHTSGSKQAKSLLILPEHSVKRTIEHIKTKYQLPSLLPRIRWTIEFDRPFNNLYTVTSDGRLLGFPRSSSPEVLMYIQSNLAGYMPDVVFQPLLRLSVAGQEDDIKVESARDWATLASWGAIPGRLQGSAFHFPGPWKIHGKQAAGTTDKIEIIMEVLVILRRGSPKLLLSHPLANEGMYIMLRQEVTRFWGNRA